MIYFGDDKMPNLCHRDYPFYFTTALNLLMKMGISLDRIDFLAVGEYQNYQGEIREQKPKPETPLRPDTRIELKVGYSGIVDIMPYQFFYGLHTGKRRSGDWELKARHLMAPFDAAAIRHETKARYQGLKFNLGVTDEGHFRRFLALFGLEWDKVEGMEDAVAWASLMPSFHDWSGNPERVAEVLQIFFGHKFRIIENVHARYEIPEDLRYRLGSKAGRLGRESIIGKDFGECDSTYRVIIQGLSRKETADYIPGGKKRKKLEWILGFCMPSDKDYRITFNVCDPEFILGRSKPGAYLGYSSHLRPGRRSGKSPGRVLSPAMQ